MLDMSQCPRLNPGLSIDFPDKSQSNIAFPFSYDLMPLTVSSSSIVPGMTKLVNPFNFHFLNGKPLTWGFALRFARAITSALIQRAVSRSLRLVRNQILTPIPVSKRKPRLEQRDSVPLLDGPTLLSFRQMQLSSDSSADEERSRIAAILNPQDEPEPPAPVKAKSEIDSSSRTFPNVPPDYNADADSGSDDLR
jgi:hypothetical protein